MTANVWHIGEGADFYHKPSVEGDTVNLTIFT